MTTRPFVPPRRVPPPEAGGGKIAVDAPIAAPVPPPRSIWGIVLPIGLIVGVVGFIIAMYVSGQRSLATGFAIFPLIMLMSMGGMLFRGRGAAQKMPWSQLENTVRIRPPRRCATGADAARSGGSTASTAIGAFRWYCRRFARMGAPSRRSGVRRGATGHRTCRLAMTIDKPQIAAASRSNPRAGTRCASSCSNNGMSAWRLVWLDHPPASLVGEMDDVRGIARSMITQLAASTARRTCRS